MCQTCNNSAGKTTRLWRSKAATICITCNKIRWEHRHHQRIGTQTSQSFHLQCQGKYYFPNQCSLRSFPTSVSCLMTGQTTTNWPKMKTRLLIFLATLITRPCPCLSNIHVLASDLNDVDKRSLSLNSLSKRRWNVPSSWTSRSFEYKIIT